IVPGRRRFPGCRPLPRAGGSPAGSWALLQGTEHLPPRFAHAWLGLGLRAPPRQLSQMPLRHLLRGNLLRQAVPNLLNQFQTFADAELVNPECFDADRHGDSSRTDDLTRKCNKTPDSREERLRAALTLAAQSNAPVPRSPGPERGRRSLSLAPQGIGLGPAVLN